jgi:hypothetical protein
MQSGKEYVNLSPALQDAYTAWTTSPVIGSFHFVADLPALLIIVLITALIYRGMKSLVMQVILWWWSNCVSFFSDCFVFYVDTANWDPFAPNGVTGVLKGVSAVFLLISV